ncbi:MAG: FTR1 family protein [Gammaproteobacteria bacterium]
MLLTSVVILLREVLEAALIISVFLAFSHLLRFSRRWLLGAFVLGGVGAASYAAGIDRISSLMGGVGQEVTNAVMQFCIYVLLVVFIVAVTYRRGRGYDPGTLPYIAVFASVVLAITREGSEILLYLYGFFYAPQLLPPVMIGGAIGAGIGFSIGVIFYYALTVVPEAKRLPVGMAVLTLIAAGMISQATQQLIQADILASQRPLWDSSGLLPEESVAGQLLYAFIGYEATPTPLQVLFYFCSIFIMAASAGVAKWSAERLESL